MAARRILLPSYIPTVLAEPGTPGSYQVLVPFGGTSTEYHIAPKTTLTGRFDSEGIGVETTTKLHLFPMVLCGDGAPWPEANLWLLSKVGNNAVVNMKNAAGNADDLAAYRRFIEESGVDWLSFPTHKLQRPTYRYNAHLKSLAANNEIGLLTAKRRMATVIRFYRWLIEEEALAPDSAPWKESDRYISFKDTHGFAAGKTVTTTDITIRVPKSDDPFDGSIEDGGKLRPLRQNEQEWLLDALFASNNTEMILIHLFGLLTGARIQTILTFRVRHTQVNINDPSQTELRLLVGPGTDIDTKNNKRMVLHVPVWFYKMLNIYALSERAQNRRLRAIGGDSGDQYLFLSNRGAPMYTSKEDGINQTGSIRHAKEGQLVRKFISDSIIPFIREKYDVPDFSYRFHDTRATFGMNLTDHQLALVDTKECSTSDALRFVKTRMCHQSFGTTERYLNYRSRMKLVRVAQDGWESKLQDMIVRAMGVIVD
jgi:integrase